MGRRLAPGTGGTAALVGTLCVTSYGTLLGFGMGHWSYDAWGALVLAPVLVAVSIPLVVRLGARVPEVGPRLLLLALVLKLCSAVVRWLQSYVLAGGADAERYHDAGVQISAALRSGTPWHAVGPFPGTAFVEGLTGYVYYVIGTSRLGGYLFFSWLGFWGLVLFLFAFRTALPRADVRRYGLLVLFLPSLLFWPSSIGKDCWMVLCLGAASLGVARLCTRQRGALILVALGLGGAVLARPHMAVLLFGGLAVGYLVRPGRPGSMLSPIVKTGGLVVLGVVGLVLVAQAERFFGGGGNDAITEAAQRTNQGGSAFETTPVSSPFDLPGAFITVLFRPFPYEASSLQALVASVEGLGLLALTARSASRLRALPRLLRREPYLAYALTYTLLFVTAFSSFGNFGILTRQRVQVFPFFLVLLALPRARLELEARRQQPADLRLSA